VNEVRSRSGLPISGLLLLGGNTLFWGVSWPFMKIVLGEIGVWSFRAMGAVLGGIGILLVGRFAGQSLRVGRSEIGPLLIVSLFTTLIFGLATSYGLTILPAGRATILLYTMPLWSTAIGVCWLRNPIKPAEMIGLALGLGGLAVLIAPDLAGIGAAPIGAASITGAALSWAIATTYTKSRSWQLSTSALVGWQTLIAAPAFMLGAHLVDRPAAILDMSGLAWFAFLFACLTGTVYGVWAWFRIVDLFPTHVASVGILGVPVVGLLSSHLILGDPISLRDVAGLGLILAALALVLIWPAFSRGSAQNETAPGSARGG
jgi:drug/metabolite transporter (DMT)-like permease